MKNPADAQAYRATIPPLGPDTQRPVWSVMIPTFNCARYLPKTLGSVLGQDPGPSRMQIEVVDDHSTLDEPAQVVERIGNKRVSFFQHSQNVGHTNNFATCLRRSQGRLVHLLHGDDYVLPGFYAKMEHAFAVEPSIGAAFCRHIFVDEEDGQLSEAPCEQRESGILENWLERLALEQRIMTPSIVVRREVYEKLGGFDARLVCVEDWEMWVRIAAQYPIWYEPQTLAAYRMHVHSNTGRHVRSGEDISYVAVAINMFKDYLPAELAARVVPQARETYALSAIEAAHGLLKKREFVAVKSQLRAALTCSRSGKVWRKLLRLLKDHALDCVPTRSRRND